MLRQLTALSDDIVSQAAWSPSGKKILYNDSSNEVYTIWPDGTHRSVISDGESYQASWSPDGKRILFLEHPTDSHISISEEDGTVIQIPFDKGAYKNIGAPQWSPDEKTTIFTLSKKQNNQQTYDLFSLSLTEENGSPILLASDITPQYGWRF